MTKHTHKKEGKTTHQTTNTHKNTHTHTHTQTQQVDKDGANPEKTKQMLAEAGLLPEEWGGETPMVPISAKTGAGIDELLETVLLVAEVEDLVANPQKLAAGTVIEAHLDKKRGAVATLLVQGGTLRVGDPVCAGCSFGKVGVCTVCVCVLCVYIAYHLLSCVLPLMCMSMVHLIPCFSHVPLPSTSILFSTIASPPPRSGPSETPRATSKRPPPPLQCK